MGREMPVVLTWRWSTPSVRFGVDHSHYDRTHSAGRRCSGVATPSVRVGIDRNHCGLTIRSVLGTMAAEYPVSLEALVLHGLTPAAATVLTTKLEEVDAAP
eukprot:9485253-Pyramimonas_sp.AAC.1